MSARHAETRKNINQPLPDPPYDFNPIINSGTVSQYDFAPFLGYAGISYSASEKYGYWNALEISVRHPVGQNLFLTASYTYQHGLGTANGIMLYQCCGGYQDIYHPQRDYGNDGVTAPQVLGITYMWNLPYQNTHGFRGMALGGWKYSGIVSAQSGLALNPGLSASHSGLATRPNRVAGSSVAGPKTRAQWFNTNAFVQPAAGYFRHRRPRLRFGVRGWWILTCLYKRISMSPNAHFFLSEPNSSTLLTTRIFQAYPRALGQELMDKSRRPVTLELRKLPYASSFER